MEYTDETLKTLDGEVRDFVVANHEYKARCREIACWDKVHNPEVEKLRAAGDFQGVQTLGPGKLKAILRQSP